ncbi:MAG: hypothetical protein PHN98_04410 [Smithellaceae bacterium]|nr:hypothetical protein [Smithellaceae bacterium]
MRSINCLLLLLAIVAVFAGGCNSGSGKDASTLPSSLAGVPRFTVSVQLSPKASAKLKKMGETIIVSASFFGYPTEAAQSKAECSGEIGLGSVDKEMDKPGVAIFEGSTYDKSKLPLIENQEPLLLINVFSGRKSSEDNLLDCSIFQDSVDRAVKDGVHIDCKLIGE